MGTKNDPGPHDCYAKAEPDEPMFTLLARDVFAPHTIRVWANMREAEGSTDPAKIAEARECADAMTRWADDHFNAAVDAGDPDPRT